MQRDTNYEVPPALLPVRIVCTKDEKIIQEIIRATNQQIPIKPTQFLALLDYTKNNIEPYFPSFSEPEKKLYFERRDGQYGQITDRTRIISRDDLIRAFASMFLKQPHRATKNFRNVTKEVGTKVFNKNHKPVVYYVAAYVLFLTNNLFNEGRIDSKLEPALWHILLAVRLLFTETCIPTQLNGKDAEKYCSTILKTLWDENRGQRLVLEAAGIVKDCVDRLSEFHRDLIRVQSFTESVVSACTEFTSSREGEQTLFGG